VIKSRLSLILGVLLSLEPNWAKADMNSLSGMSVKQLRLLVDHLPADLDPIQAVRIIRSGPGPLLAISVHSAEKGWEIFVFQSDEQSVSALWRSGKLPDTFTGSAPGALKSFDFGDEEGLEFEGCFPSACSSVFSVLLYIPSKQSAFMATNVNGKISYSATALQPEFSKYKDGLDQLLKEH